MDLANEPPLTRLEKLPWKDQEREMHITGLTLTDLKTMFDPQTQKEEIKCLEDALFLVYTKLVQFTAVLGKG